MRNNILLLAIGLCCGHSNGLVAAEPTTGDRFDRHNLVAWCIVPFDGKQRGPDERAEMIVRLGLRRVAYDWREQHVPTFEQEILEYQRRGIDLFAFWSVHEAALQLFEKYQLSPQIWQIVPQPGPGSQAAKVKQAAEQMLPLVDRTRTLGSKLGLYNHGGWSGEPENLVAVCEYLRQHHDADHVGIVYNQHHGHQHIERFAAALQLMQPYLLCLNLNGMSRGGEKIVPLGGGEMDLALLSIIQSSAYQGPIGIIGHTQDDVEQRLLDNLDGLQWLRSQLDGSPPPAKPKYRTWKVQAPPAEAPPPETPQAIAPTGSGTRYSSDRVKRWVADARARGDARRGLVVFSSAKTACLACHRIGNHGGAIGPDLVKTAPTRPTDHLVESVLWPDRQIDKPFLIHRVVTDDGSAYRGFIIRRDDQQLVLRDPSAAESAEQRIAVESIETEHAGGTIMPDNLVSTMSEQQACDLFQFLFSLGQPDGVPADEMNALLAHASIHAHGPAEFPYDRKPLDPRAWPSWNAAVNRGRLYDYYAKQADYFRDLDHTPPLLPAFPGLDGGNQGHWGNQNEETWASNHWNEVKLGSVQCGVFRGGDVTVPRGVCVQLGDDNQLAVCFNPDTLTYDAAWTGPFLKFSSVRHGFMDGVIMAGQGVDFDGGTKPKIPFAYHGFYRVGRRVVFAYRIGDQEYLDSPWVDDDGFVRRVIKINGSPAQAAGLGEDVLRKLAIQPADARWPQVFPVPIEHGQASPYAIDSIGSPGSNPWNATFFIGGLDFNPDGSAIVATMRGDVWKVAGLPYPSKQATWRRIAAGLHQSLGVVVDDDGTFVLGRDQITRLHDFDGDGEADFYECFSNAFETSIHGHDFICGLQRDREGNFYIASGNQGVVRISPDGRRGDVVASGFRNPDGLGVTPDGLLTVPCSEGNWTPATMICGVKLGGSTVPYFGYPGPRDNQPPALPMVYLPRGIDNSAGGQIAVTSDRWGPLTDQLIHFSFGAGAHFLLLRDEVDDQLQGAIVPLPGEFRSGVHRGRFSPADGQLYVGGMQGWGSYTTDGGCFQRVRYTGDRVQLPISIRAHLNGVMLRFSAPLDQLVAQNPDNHFAQCWNYRYSGSYGSPEYSAKHFGVQGHDSLAIVAAHVGTDQKSLFLEIPDLQPVNQLHLRIQTGAGEFRDLFATVHRLDRPYTEFDGYRPITKRVARHPILADLARATKQVANPHQAKLDGARHIKVVTGSNLTFRDRVIRAHAGEPVAITLENPDVVPHNWALLRPGTLETVGRMANQLISDPDAALRHYVPETEDVLAFTDVVLPKERFTIYFHVPREPGRYPYLCTFPGHWSVMNGVMIVE